MRAMASVWLTVARVAASAVMSAAVVIVAIVSIIVTTVATTVATTAAMHDGHAVVAIDRTTVAIVGCNDSALVD
jgi:hypothetical protein